MNPRASWRWSGANSARIMVFERAATLNLLAAGT